MRPLPRRVRPTITDNPLPARRGEDLHGESLGDAQARRVLLGPLGNPPRAQGAGPNLYLLFLASGAARRIDAVDRSAAGLDCLRRQLADGPDPTWRPFWDRCRALNPGLPPTAEAALHRVRVRHGDAFALTGAGYDLASMHFVAESVTEDADEFAGFCAAFAAAVRPGGHLLAAFMENMGRYALGDGSRWPGLPVDADAVTRTFTPLTMDLEVTRIDADPDLPDYGYTGMVLLSARRS